jgi:hypothetical protein
VTVYHLERKSIWSKKVKHPTGQTNWTNFSWFEINRTDKWMHYNWYRWNRLVKSSLKNKSFFKKLYELNCSNLIFKCSVLLLEIKMNMTEIRINKSTAYSEFEIYFIKQYY